MTRENVQRTTPRVIIAGGGIGGLSAALGLRNAGIEVTVLERAEEFAEIGAGIQLAPNAFRALAALKVGDEIFKNAVFVDRLVMLDAIDSHEIASMSVGESFRKWFHHPYAVIHRGELYSCLRSRCMADSGVELRSRSEVVSFTQDSHGVDVVTADGKSIRGDALLGADGIRSRVRSIVLGDGPPKISGHVSYRAVLPIAEMPEQLRWNAMVVWVGPQTHLVHYPLSDWKLFNIVATFHSVRDTAEQHNAVGSREELLSYFGHLPELPRSLLEKPRSWGRWVLGDREPVANWTSGRVTLLGDAAHPMHQYFAQGACMALEDAVCLSEEVLRAGGDFERAFVAYQERRIARTARVALSARAIGRYLFHVEGVERLVRNEMMSSKSQDDMCRGLNWVYGYGMSSNEH